MDVTDNYFDEKVLKQSKTIPVVVDFWAEWCMPCRMLKPVLEKLAVEYKGKFILAKVNVEEAPKISNKLNISSIPCVKMFKHGKVIDEFTGSRPESSVKQWLDKNLK